MMRAGGAKEALLLGWLALGANAWAQAPAGPDPSTAARGRELYENGEILYQEGSYAAAIEAWNEGWRLTHEPDFLWNIAAAQERLADLRAALETLDRYRAFASAEERPSIERRIRNLELRLADQAAPQPLPVPILAPAPVPAPADRALPGPVPERPKTSLDLRQGVGWSLLATATAGLALGGVYGWQAGASRGEANGLCAKADGELLCSTAAQGALTQGRRRALAADLGFGLGAAAGAVGLVVLLPMDKAR